VVPAISPAPDGERSLGTRGHPQALTRFLGTARAPRGWKTSR
jgi:hypothetical protein